MSTSKRQAIRALFERNRRKLLALLSRRVGPDAAPDLLQEAFLRVLKYENFDGVSDPGAFLQATAVNLSRDYARRRKAEGAAFPPAAEDTDAPAADGTPDDILAAKERTERLLAAVDALPPKCREVFIMRRFEDRSQQEIAEKLGISRNMVEKHLRLALERCRAALEED